MVDPDDETRADEKAPPRVPGYRLGARIGAGGSGVVWAATRDGDGSPVAVKVVPVGVGEQADAAVRELGVLGRVEVDGLVRFHEAVALPGADRRVALVLDHVAGGSLARVVGARGHLNVGESVTVLAPVARTLAGLHAVGVQHGDVTPGNVLLERSGRPLLADLGVAGFVGEAPGHAVGTAGFVAPEVVDGGPVTPAADVYAAGALAWWCVTGQAPEPVSWRPPLETLAPEVPDAWRDVTTRALAADPADRPSAAELALAWFDSAPCEPVRLVVGTDETSLLTQRLRRPPSDHEAAPGVAAPVEVGTWLRRSRTCLERPRTRAGVAGAGLLSALVLGALLATGVVRSPGWLGPGRPTDDPARVARSTERGAPAPGPRASLTARTPSPSVSPRHAQRDHRAPTLAPQALVQELATLRAEVMVSGRDDDLADLDAPGSAALDRDTADLRRVREAGVAYAGVRLTVRSARPDTVTTRSATVEAVVDTAAYRVVSATDARRVVRREAAVRGQALRFVLVWSGGRWLVERVEAVA